MGLPIIDISFKELISSVVMRSRRGTGLLIIRDSSAGAEDSAEYTAAPEHTGFNAINEGYIKMAFLGGVSRLRVINARTTYEAALAEANSLAWDWLAAPYADAQGKELIVNFIKSARAVGKTFKAVLGAYENADCEAIVNLASGGIVSDILGRKSEYTAEEYSPYIMGILAGTALDSSLTGLALPDIYSAELRLDADADVDEGRLIIIPNGNSYEIARGVTSLAYEGSPAAFRKIKNVEGADMIRDDIARIFRSFYKGKKTNSYANKQALCADIIAYFGSLEGDVLSPDFDNIAEIDTAAQREYLSGTGADVADRTDREIALMNTGETVFLKAKIQLLDAIEDVSLEIRLN